MLVLIDNYDSFTFNLFHYLGGLGADVRVHRNDKISAADVIDSNPEAIVLSPGPCTPNEAGICLDLIKKASPTIPVLGVCLGHQALVLLHGGTVAQARDLVHGKATVVRHDGKGIFEGLPEDFLAGRYHSLAATSIPHAFEVSATAADGEVMAIRHRELAIDGVQFHPESVLTPHGRDIAKNFLEGRR